MKGQPPTFVRAEYGGMGGFVSVEGDGASLTWIEYHGDETTETKLDPSSTQWAKFWLTVEDAWGLGLGTAI